MLQEHIILVAFYDNCMYEKVLLANLAWVNGKRKITTSKKRQ